ncbi:hypothetical protein GCM10010191_56350 [Actinomadura vinacea]|uniref:Uncharacterized protein n=1 Tax=Actinomadura vinacea TaxID=115336 RepID=A0ABN3JQ93_9ACTN
MDDLLAAIGTALGLDGPYTETPAPGSGGFSLKTMHESPAGAGRAVLDGTTDGARVAWVEEVSGEPQNGYIPVDLTINVAGPGLPHVQVDVATYNPYFGCNVHGMRLFDDSLVVVYTEKHKTIGARVDLPSGEQSLFTLGDRCALVDDLVCHIAYRGDRIELLSLPDMTTCVPLPSTDFADWRLPDQEQRGRPDTRIVWSKLRHAFAEIGMGHEDADILIGTAAVPFLYAERPFARTYGHLYRPKEGTTPWWFPVAWHHHLTAEGHPSRWPEWLDALPGEFTGWQEHWDIDEGAARLTLAYLGLHASEMAAACREGRLPSGDWRDWREGWDHPQPIGAFPKGFRRAWNQLPTTYRPA